MGMLIYLQLYVNLYCYRMWITADLFSFFFFLPHFWVWCIIRKETLLKSVTGSSSITVDPTQVTQISWNPRFYFFYYCGFYVVCLIIFLDNCWYGICCSFVFYRAFLYRGFLTDEECDHLIALVSLYFLFLFEWMLIYIYMYQWNFFLYIYPCVIQKTLFFLVLLHSAIWEFTLTCLLVNGVYLVGFVWVG